MLNTSNRYISPGFSLPFSASDLESTQGPARWQILTMKEPVSLNHYVESCLLNTHTGPEARHKFRLGKAIKMKEIILYSS